MRPDCHICLPATTKGGERVFWNVFFLLSNPIKEKKDPILCLLMAKLEVYCGKPTQGREN